MTLMTTEFVNGGGYGATTQTIAMNNLSSPGISFLRIHGIGIGGHYKSHWYNTRLIYKKFAINT